MTEYVKENKDLPTILMDFYNLGSTIHSGTINPDKDDDK